MHMKKIVIALLCIAFIAFVATAITQNVQHEQWKDVPNPNNLDYDRYPYNDSVVLDYVGMPIESVYLDSNTIIFNEITDIQAFRQFNTIYGYNNVPYYSTRTTAYDLLTAYPIRNESDFLNVHVFKQDGSIDNCPNYDEFLICAEKVPLAAELAMHILENVESTGVNIYYNAEIDTVGLHFMPESNCVATLIIGRDLDIIDERFANILPILRKTLGTQNSSNIGGQEVSVHYFYQNRLYRGNETEEAYQYYAYYEKNDLQYLYQFSSNWSLIGQNVSAMHNPPVTLHFVKTQDECRVLFVDYIAVLG